MVNLFTIRMVGFQMVMKWSQLFSKLQDYILIKAICIEKKKNGP